MLRSVKAVMKMLTKALMLCLLISLIKSGDASLLDWIWGGADENAAHTQKIGDIPIVKVPFEITTEDEKFLEEAKNYTSMKLSDLDDCQHLVGNGEYIKFVIVITDIMAIFIRLKQYDFLQVVIKIRNSCSDLTEEELAKMSVDLLNCQSALEGRHFPCTSSMVSSQFKLTG
jgi:hypothetical protein